MKDPWRLHQQNSFINILPQNPPRLRILHTSMQLHEDLAFWLYPSLHKVPWDESSGFNVKTCRNIENKVQHFHVACWRRFFPAGVDSLRETIPDNICKDLSAQNTWVCNVLDLVCKKTCIYFKLCLNSETCFVMFVLEPIKLNDNDVDSNMEQIVHKYT